MHVGKLLAEYLWTQNIIDVEFVSNYTTHRCHYTNRYKPTQKLLTIFTSFHRISKNRYVGISRPGH